MGGPVPATMQAVVCHGPEDYRLEEVAVPEPGPGRGAGPGRGGGHLRQRPEVLPRRREVLGRRRPAGLGGDRGDPRPRVRRRGRAGRRRGASALGRSTAGDRVVSEQIVPCWTCRYCLRGQYWMCAPHDIYGFKRAHARRHGRVHGLPGRGAGAQDQRTTCRRPTRRSPSRCPARCTPSSGPASPSTTSSWSPAADRSGSAWSAGARGEEPRPRRRAGHGAAKARPGRACGADDDYRHRRARTPSRWSGT